MKKWILCLLFVFAFVSLTGCAGGAGQYGDITVTQADLDYARLVLENKSPDAGISEEDVLELALKRKLLIRDANKRGLFVTPEKIDQAASEMRENLRESEKQYDKYIEMSLEYSLLYYDYAKLLYEELSKTQPDVVFGDEMVDAYLDKLLVALKQDA